MLFQVQNTLYEVIKVSSSMVPARNSSSTMGLQQIFKISHELFYKQKQ